MERPSGDQAQASSAVAMTDEEERALREQLARLLQEHRDLDAAIEALVTSPGSDLIAAADQAMYARKDERRGLPAPVKWGE